MLKNRFRFFAVLAVILLLSLLAAAMAAAEKNFSVGSFSPKGLTTDRRAQIRVEFTIDVVSGDDIDRRLEEGEQPFVFNPQIQGEGMWKDARTFIFTPSKLDQAERYIATASPKLRDLGGRLLKGTKSFAFHTPPLQFVGAAQSGFTDDLGQVFFELEFSQPVSVNRLDGYLSLSGKSGKVEPRILTHRSNSRILVLQIPRDAGKINGKIAKGFPPTYGVLGLEKEALFTLAPEPSMAILETNVASGTSTSSIIINTNLQVDFAKIDPFVEVKPETKYVIEPRSRGFAVVGDFKPQDRITVTLKKGLPSSAGLPLEKEWTRAFIFPD